MKLVKLPNLQRLSCLSHVWVNPERVVAVRIENGFVVVKTDAGDVNYAWGQNDDALYRGSVELAEFIEKASQKR